MLRQAQTEANEFLGINAVNARVSLLIKIDKLLKNPLWRGALWAGGFAVAASYGLSSMPVMAMMYPALMLGLGAWGLSLGIDFSARFFNLHDLDIRSFTKPALLIGIVYFASPYPAIAVIANYCLLKWVADNLFEGRELQYRLSNPFQCVVRPLMMAFAFYLGSFVLPLLGADVLSNLTFFMMAEPVRKFMVSAKNIYDRGPGISGLVSEIRHLAGRLMSIVRLNGGGSDSKSNSPSPRSPVRKNR